MSDIFASGVFADADQWLDKGAQAVTEGRFAEAVDILERVIEARPYSDDVRYQLARALNGQTMVLAGEGRFQDALPLIQRAVEVDSADVDSVNILGYVLTSLGRLPEATAAYQRATELEPRQPEIWYNLGAVLGQADQHAEAEIAYGRVVALQPDHFLAVANRGFSLVRTWRRVEAVECFEAALKLHPDDIYLKMALVVNRIFFCDWRQRDELLNIIEAGARRGDVVLEAFEALALFDDPELHKRVAEMTVRVMTGGPKPQRRHTPASGKIRLGYLSADFHNHATSYLMAEVFERHDRDRFEVVAFSTGPISDDMQARLRGAFDAFHEVGPLDDDALGAFIAGENIEILVDLKGFTGMGRTAAMASRPAPVQVNYLGYPGTLGADFVDYVVGDPFVTPKGCEPYFSEKVVRLPHSYQPNSLRPDAPQPTRAQYGLPDSAVVFCCFNGAFKITPDVFSSWMRILAATPGSVLWLMLTEEAMRTNLRREAQARGVDPGRLIFATFAPLPEHMARLGLADVVLDTAPYNAHTTCSDALWAGVPVVTCAGKSFASRVAMGLVTAAGAPELNRPSWEDYEAFAISLGRDPEAIRAWKAKLLGLKATAPLFNVAAFTRDLEAAFVKMSKRWRAGLPPEGFDA